VIDPSDFNRQVTRIRETICDLRSAQSSSDRKWERQINKQLLLMISVLFDEIQYQVEKDRVELEKEKQSCLLEDLCSGEARFRLKLQFPEPPDAGHAN